MTTAATSNGECKLDRDTYNSVLDNLKAEGIDPGREEVDTEFNYSRCLEEISAIIPSTELDERIVQALEFIQKNIFTKEGNITKMELLVESKILDYFAIPKGINHPIGKIFRRGYNDALKAKKKEIANQKKAIDKLKNSTFTISDEFDGLYQKSVSSVGNLIIEPYYDRIAEFVSTKLNTVVFNGNLFVYDSGCYRANKYIPQAEATRVISGIMKNENSRDISGRLKDLMTFIENCNIVNEYPFNKHINAFPVRNGVIVFDLENYTFELEENPDPNIWKFDYVLDVDYNSEADSFVILDTLKKYLYDNPEQPSDMDESKGRYDYKVIIQMVAQGILQAMGYGPYKSLYLYVGQPDSGKTTIIDLVTYFIGRNCRCTIGLNEFTSGDKFVMAGKEGKIFNLHDDLGYFKMSDSGTLKAMSGGYDHKIERKGKDRYDGHITSVDAFTANYPAGFNRNIYIDKAFWERWYYIYCPNQFAKNAEFKIKTFTEENKSALLNVVIETMVDMLKAKDLVVKKEEWTEVRKKWMQASNILNRFIEDNITAGSRTSLMKEELFTALKAWCIDNKQGEDMLPQRSYDLADSVELCGGIGDAQRVFRNKGTNPHHCFVLPYNWKPLSRYKKYCPTEALTDQDFINSYI